MAHRLLWAVAIALMALMLVAGCVNVDIPDIPEGPYVVGGEQPAKEPTAQQRERIEGMSDSALQDEVLRLTAENDSLQQQVGELKRKIKQLEREKDQLEDRIDKLED